MAAGMELGRVQQRLTTQLDNAFGQPVGVGHFFVGMDQKFFCNRSRGQAAGGKIMPLVAQHTYPLGCQGVVEQFADFTRIRLNAGGDSTFPEMAGFGSTANGRFVKLQGGGVGGCMVHDELLHEMKGGSESGFASGNQGQHKQDKKDEKKDFTDGGSSSGNAEKAEKSGHQGNDKKYHGVIEHGVLRAASYGRAGLPAWTAPAAAFIANRETR